MNATVTLTDQNFDDFVRQSTKPVVVDFWAEWCGPCKMLAPVLEDIAREYAGQVAIAKVNIDENPTLAERYHIQSIPTLFYFKDGAIRDQTIGVLGKKAIVNRLTTLTESPAATPSA